MPANPTIMKEIETFYNRKKYQEAIQLADQCLKVDTKDWPVLAWKALCLYRMGDQAAGQKIIEEILQKNPSQPHALRVRGVMKDDKGDLDAAIRDYNQAIRLDEKHTLAYLSRGDAYSDKGDLDAAIRDYTQAIRLDENLASAYYNRGVAYFNKGDLDAAIHDYNQAIRLDEKDASAYNIRGVAYYNKGDLDAAIRDYNQAIRLDEKDASAYNRRGLAYKAKGDLDAAIRDHNETIRLDEKDASAYYNRGITYKAKGDLDAAIRDYNEAIRLDEKFAFAYNNRGLAYYEKGDLDTAIRDYNEAIRLDPKLEIALNNLQIAARKRGSIGDILIVRSRANAIDLKKLRSDDQESQFFFERCRQMVQERTLPNLHSETFIDYWFVQLEWGRVTRPGLIFDGNSTYIHDARYGLGVLALTDKSVWIISIGDISKRAIKGPGLFGKGIGMLLRNYDFSKVEKEDRIFEFSHSSIQTLEKNDDRIILKTGTETWTITTADLEIIFPALNLARQGKLGEILQPPKPAERGQPDEDVFDQIEKLKKLLDMGALTQEEFNDKKKVLLSKIA